MLKYPLEKDIGPAPRKKCPFQSTAIGYGTLYSIVSETDDAYPYGCYTSPVCQPCPAIPG